jgi:hypothetical protein
MGISYFSKNMKQSNLFWFFLCSLWLGAGSLQAQKLSNKPEEYIGQVHRLLVATNQPPVIQAADNFKAAWEGGLFGAGQQTKIMAISQKILDKRLRTAVDLKDFLAALQIGVEKKGVRPATLDNILEVTQKAFEKYDNKQMILHIERLKDLLVYEALYRSEFNNVYVSDKNYLFAYIEPNAKREQAWFRGWDEAEPLEEYDENGNLKKYPFPKVEGAVILFDKTDLIFVTAYDSVSLSSTKGAYIFQKDAFVGEKGRFNWDNMTVKTSADSSAKIARSRPQIYADFEKYSFLVKDPLLKAENVSLTYQNRIKESLKGRFEYQSQNRKNEKEVRYPFFQSYRNDVQLDVNAEIKYFGGVSVRGRELHGSTLNKAALGYLSLMQEGKKQLQARTKEIKLEENEIRSSSVNFSFYFSDGDSLWHSDLSLIYQVTNNPRDSASGTFRFLKEKSNEEIPFIDNYHQIYITADMAVYNPKKRILDFYIVGATDRKPALFESYSYFNEERYTQLQGLYGFHPLKVLEKASQSEYASTDAQGNRQFNLALLNEYVKKDASTLKTMLRSLSRRGYILFNEATEEITILNRTSYNEASSVFKNTISRVESQARKNRKANQKFADAYEQAINNSSPNTREQLSHDYDDMLIQSLSPRDVKMDSVIVDTNRFVYTRQQMLLAKLEGRDVYFTRRVFSAYIDSLQMDSIVRFDDTLKIDKFKTSQRIAFNEDLKRYNLSAQSFGLDTLEGFFLTGRRIAGPYRPNATIDVVSGGITIRGIDRFTISKALNVNIIPRYKEVQIYKERDILLEHGEVTVGNYRFIGKNFVLPYAEFKLTMAEIDTVLFAIKDLQDTTRTIELGAEIRMNAGELQISHSSNKSGLKKGRIPGADKAGDTYEAYPKLVVEDGGTIFFNQFYRQRNAYHRGQAYFVIPKLVLDSLTSHIPRFSGVFYSNMFEPIKEDLIPIYDPDYNGVESRYSLGFIHKPKKNYKIYKTDAELSTDSLVMFKTKFVAKGNNEVKHLTYTLKGRDFIFAPDSVIGERVNLDVKQAMINKIAYPRAYVKNGRLAWFTTERIGKDTLAIDSMTVRSREELVTVFGDKNPLTINGKVAVTPRGLWGIGTLLRKDFFLFAPQAAQITPTAITTPNTMDNTCDFKVSSSLIDPYDVAAVNNDALSEAILRGNGVAVDYDLASGLCKVMPNKFILEEAPDYLFIEFPYAKFKTSIREATWDLNKSQIIMTGDTTSYFTAYKYEGEEENKNLQFYAVGGRYDLKDLSNPRLDLEGVPFVIAADARIYPYEGRISLLEGGDVQELTKARLVIDTLNGYHNLIDGNIKINHKLEFQGNAIYRYVSVDKDTARIQFNQFFLLKEMSKPQSRREKPKELIFTKSSGEVTEEDKFFITNRIQFKGEVEMLANEKDLKLDGFVKLDLRSKQNFYSWIPYKGNAADVVIEQEERKIVGADTLTSGLHYDAVDGKIYTTFLSKKQHPIDVDMFLGSGSLTYNPSINEFKVTTKAKGDNRSYQGNRLVFDDSKAVLNIEGKIQLVDAETAKYMKSSGNGKYDLNDGAFQLNTFYVFDFKNPSAAFSGMGAVLQANKAPTANATKNDPYLLYKMAEFIGHEKTAKYEQESKQLYIPLVKTDKVLNKPLVISNVDLRWNEGAKSFHSVGKLSIANVYDKDINAEFEGYMEIRKVSSGDIVNIYIEATKDIWFYYSFQNGILSGVSSEDGFNKLMAKGKPQRKVGEYTFELIDEFSMLEFKKRFKAVYIDGLDPEQFANPQEEKKEEKKDDKDGF